jgi:hypothetical protein
VQDICQHVETSWGQKLQLGLDNQKELVKEKGRRAVP